MPENETIAMRFLVWRNTQRYPVRCCLSIQPKRNPWDNNQEHTWSINLELHITSHLGDMMKTWITKSPIWRCRWKLTSKVECSPWFKVIVSFPVGVAIKSNCESFMSEAILTPRPAVHWYFRSDEVYATIKDYKGWLRLAKGTYKNQFSKDISVYPLEKLVSSWCMWLWLSNAGSRELGR